MSLAIVDWEKGVKMNERDVQQSGAYNLAVAYDSIGKESLAKYYLDMARATGYKNISDEFVAKVNRKLAVQQRK
jgi:hypothetical protein